MPKKKQYQDTVFRFSKENNIEIPKPIILEEKLTAIESQEKEDFWKKKYVSDGWKTLNKATTGKNKGSLGACLKWDFKSCLEESKKYNSKIEMKEQNQSAYNSSVKNGWIDLFFEVSKKKNNYWDNIERVLEAAKQSDNARDMVKRFGGAYNAARKNGWIKLLIFKQK